MNRLVEGAGIIGMPEDDSEGAKQLVEDGYLSSTERPTASAT
jgi:hypothetical protein